MVPILLGFLREDLPWVYELGMEGYRQITTGNVVQGHESFRRLLNLIDWAVHSVSDSSELHIAIMELRQVLRTIVGHGEITNR